jgi:Trypsin-like peptidase domain
MTRYSLFGILGLFFLIPLTLSAATDDSAMMSSVLKIKTYQKNPIDGNYTPLHYGSAVLIDEKRLVTNAHVILDTDGNNPTGYYEVCRTEQNKKVPTCFTVGKLLYFDKILDLAVLDIAATPIKTKKLLMSEGKSLSIGTSIIVYGYPGIGGASITRTE